MTAAERAAESPHPTGDDPHWSESWYVDFADDDGVGGFLRLQLVPHRRQAWLWACLVTPDRLVEVRDHEVPLPRGAGLEVRSTGLWADVVCETPMSHWTFGLEAFAVALSDPADAYRGERGERVALGFDLEWEAMAPPFDHPGASAKPGCGHYQHGGAVHGDILLGDETLSFDGLGERDHQWGPRDWWGVGWHWSAFRVDGGRVAVSVARPAVPGSEHATGYVATEGEEPHPLLRAEVRTEGGDDGIPRRAAYSLETGLEVEMEVLAAAPFLVPHPDGGPASRLPRALGRFTTSEGSGTGWAEWLQPG